VGDSSNCLVSTCLIWNSNSFRGAVSVIQCLAAMQALKRKRHFGCALGAILLPPVPQVWRWSWRFRIVAWRENAEELGIHCQPSRSCRTTYSACIVHHFGDACCSFERSAAGVTNAGVLLYKDADPNFNWRGRIGARRALKIRCIRCYLCYNCWQWLLLHVSGTKIGSTVCWVAFGL